jgi:hypothetical protein
MLLTHSGEDFIVSVVVIQERGRLIDDVDRDKIHTGLSKVDSRVNRRVSPQLSTRVVTMATPRDVYW